ncbi:hypothetical protein SAMN04490248_104113 [Salinihabitans flavidus]|uniref:Uncharacterized protein n=1 Tax=Salinihabitans flavidus TaxID=569882 RepID=A0A1H8P3H5_9RHOB|nr:hypothetical protein SAMN04490248_104113 [Salinihabitans flavidus]
MPFLCSRKYSKSNARRVHNAPARRETVFNTDAIPTFYRRDTETGFSEISAH